MRRGSPKVRNTQWAEFLEHLEISGNATEAAKRAGFDVRTAHYRKTDDAEFAKQWDEAMRISRSILRDEAVQEGRRRAIDGVPEFVVSVGKIVRDENGNPLELRRYSDSLLSKLIDWSDETFRPKAPGNHDDDLPAELKPDPPATPDEPGPEKPIL